VSYELTLLIDMPEKETKFGRQEVITAGEMLIGFEDLEIIGGLSREAMAYKWQNEDNFLLKPIVFVQIKTQDMLTNEQQKTQEK
jgi:hypothetical protein